MTTRGKKSNKGNKGSREASPTQTQLNFATNEESSNLLRVPPPDSSNSTPTLGGNSIFAGTSTIINSSQMAADANKDKDIEVDEILGNNVVTSLFVPPLRDLSPTSGKKYQAMTKKALNRFKLLAFFN